MKKLKVILIIILIFCAIIFLRKNDSKENFEDLLQKPELSTIIHIERPNGWISVSEYADYNTVFEELLNEEINEKEGDDLKELVVFHYANKLNAYDDRYSEIRCIINPNPSGKGSIEDVKKWYENTIIPFMIDEVNLKITQPITFSTIANKQSFYFKTEFENGYTGTQYIVLEEEKGFYYMLSFGCGKSNDCEEIFNKAFDSITFKSIENYEKNKDDFSNNWSTISQKEFIEICETEYYIDEEISTLFDYNDYKDYCYCGLEYFMKKWPSEEIAEKELLDMTEDELFSLWEPCAEKHFLHEDYYENEINVETEEKINPQNNNYIPQSINREEYSPQSNQ